MATKSDLLARWNTTTETGARNTILEELKAAHLFPADFTRQWEQDTGAYPSQSPDPDYQDPLFLQKLLAKREFAESLQKKWTPDDDVCGSTDFFEVTPVQRFAANLMSPRSPYMSALLYHGVGVGKTCAAVQISEAWLHEFPKDHVYLIAPPTIQEGFYKTMFNVGKVKFGSGDQDPNSATGCTGSTYMELTGTLLERNPERIQRRIDKAIRRRYRVSGYLQFANYVNKLISKFKGLPDAERIEQEKRAISKEFSGKLMIIDEAHNLRDILSGELEESAAKGDTNADEPNEPGGADAKRDMAQGKIMTPFLQKVLAYSRGLKLVLLTATPMYNTYKEIVFILNLLLMNDKKALLSEKDIFRSDGSLRSSGEEILGRIASRYVSFMRGENPNSFPIRLFPQDVETVGTVEDYPLITPRKGSVPDDQKEYIEHLPIVSIPLPEDSDNYKASVALMDELQKSEKDTGISPTMIKPIIQAGNFIAPGPEGENDVRSYRERLKPSAIEEVLERIPGPPVTYRAREEGGAAFLALANLMRYSPKFVFLIKRLATCEGVAFVYSQFVEAGALPLALALEANGYKPYGRTPLLADGVQDGLGGQCAKCEKRQKNHKGEAHPFVQATYGLLTGVTALSPNNEKTIQAEKGDANRDGAIMKVVIGSQIAAEGVDFRFIREVHVLDAWYHLNKTEQVIGRAIRYCSHSALEKEKRNTTIYLYAATYPDRSQETADLYSYRQAFDKAAKVGAVTRALKIRAIDCNLNHDAIIISGQGPKPQIDAQRKGRSVEINDMPYTAVCDWAECNYRCKPEIKVDIGKSEDSTYSEFAAKWREAELKRRLQSLFLKQPFYEYAQLWDAFADVPVAARTEFLSTVVDNKLFQVDYKGIKGYIKFCNKYFVFQPNVYMDLNIPLAIRMANFPVRKDEFMPKFIKREEETAITTSVAVADSGFTLPVTWKAFEDWIEEGTTSGEFPEVSEPVKARLDAMAQGNMPLLGKLQNIIEAMEWLHTSVIETDGSMTAYKKVVLEFLWDTFFTLEEQKSLVASGVHGFASKLGSTVRYYNPANGENIYMCKGVLCSAALVDAAKTQEAEERATFMAQSSPFKVGKTYGFTFSKEGTLYFKTNTPPKKTLAKGSICIIVTNMVGKYSKLLELGDVLRAAGKPDLGLKESKVMAGPRKVENAVRGCTLIELVLRYMDAEKINGLRWFFRAAEARGLGHKGLFPLLSSAEEKTTATMAASMKKTSKKSAKEEEVKTVSVKAATKAASKAPVVSVTKSVVAPASVASVAVSKKAPVVSVTKSIAAPPETASAVTASKKAPLVSVTKSVAAPASAVTVSKKAPVVSVTKSVAAPASAVTVSKKAPLVSVTKVTQSTVPSASTKVSTKPSLVSVTKAPVEEEEEEEESPPKPSTAKSSTAKSSLLLKAVKAPVIPSFEEEEEEEEEESPPKPSVTKSSAAKPSLLLKAAKAPVIPSFEEEEEEESPSPVKVPSKSAKVPSKSAAAPPPPVKVPSKSAATPVIVKPSSKVSAKPIAALAEEEDDF
jgi:hypothetical protein